MRLRKQNGVIAVVALGFALWGVPSGAQGKGDQKASSGQGAAAPDAKPATRPSLDKQLPLAATPPKDQGAARKIVIRHGGLGEPATQIVTGMTPEEAARERQESEQFLKLSDNDLNLLSGRTLDARQQETVSQIRNYVAGARRALSEGALSRAHTLAEKASLLADDLVKH